MASRAGREKSHEYSHLSGREGSRCRLTNWHPGFPHIHLLKNYLVYSAPMIRFLSPQAVSLRLVLGRFTLVRPAVLGGPLGDSLAAFPSHCMPCSDAQLPEQVGALLIGFSLGAGPELQHQPGILPLCCARYYHSMLHISGKVQNKCL